MDAKHGILVLLKKDYECSKIEYKGNMWITFMIIGKEHGKENSIKSYN